MAKQLQKTNKATFKGIMYIPSIKQANKVVLAHKHIKAETLTDEDAIILLKSGHLKESDFEILPKGYKIEKKVEKTEKKAK